MNKNIITFSVLIILALLLLASLAYAGDLETLNDTKNQLNVKIIELSGASQLNAALLKDCARRDVRYDESIAKLKAEVLRLIGEMKKLEAPDEAPAYKKVD